MGKLFFLLVACAAAVGGYMYWYRKSPDDVRDEFMSATSRAREYATDMLDKASDVTSTASSKASDQYDRARDAVKV